MAKYFWSAAVDLTPFDPEQRIKDIVQAYYEDAIFWKDHYTSTPEYYRNEAEALRKDPYLHCNRDYPSALASAEDCFHASAEDMDEAADEIECGFEGGETI